MQFIFFHPVFFSINLLKIFVKATVLIFIDLWVLLESEKETKEARIHIRVTATEKELFQVKKAQASEMSLGRFLT